MMMLCGFLSFHKAHDSVLCLWKILCKSWLDEIMRNGNGLVSESKHAGLLEVDIWICWMHNEKGNFIF